MGSTTILRGFKVSVNVLDEFLLANDEHDTIGIPPLYEDHPDNDDISKLLHKKITAAGGTADKSHFRVMIPSREGCNHSTIAYVTYAWVTIWAQLELHLDKQLPEEPPLGFEALRNEILSHGRTLPDHEKILDEGKMGMFAVFTDGMRGIYAPRVLHERAQAPQACDQCDAIFDNSQAWTQRQRHRRDVHGSKEGINPLPEA